MCLAGVVGEGGGSEDGLVAWKCGHAYRDEVHEGLRPDVSDALPQLIEGDNLNGHIVMQHLDYHHVIVRLHQPPARGHVDGGLQEPLTYSRAHSTIIASACSEIDAASTT